MKIDILLKGLALGVDVENIFSSLYVGIVYCDLTVKSAGTEKRGVEYIGAVGCRDNDNAVI